MYIAYYIIVSFQNMEELNFPFVCVSIQYIQYLEIIRDLCLIQCNKKRQALLSSSFYLKDIILMSYPYSPFNYYFINKMVHQFQLNSL